MKEVIDIGDETLCDFCNADYTNDDAKGGILFGSNAVCPECTPRVEADAKKYNETSYIKDRAREGETFHDFCLRLRNGNNTITIESF
jgi:hypothetical protein